MVPVRMARSAFDSMSVRRASGGGWKAMLWMASVGGVGFAGYVFLVPYQKMQSTVPVAHGRAGVEHTNVAEAAAERDKLKAQLAKFTEPRSEKASATRSARATSTRSSPALRPSLGARSARRGRA